jgi:plasmid replication initiation protein
MNKTLLPDKHKQKDFFICDISDTFKDDLASMEHPFFSLSKKPDHRLLRYERNNSVIEVKPSFTGLATIYDKDILLYLASSLVNAKNNREEISKTVRFSAYDYLVSTNKSLGGTQYQVLKDGLDRLVGTRIQTNIKTNGKEIINDFGLIDSFGIIKEDAKGKAIAVEVKLSDWFYNSILGDEVLTIDRDYFRLRKPTERRLYELARKHCGNQSCWKIKLENLQDKLGITSPLKHLRYSLKAIITDNHLPEYNISMENDVVLFTRKMPPKPPSKSQVEKSARRGETYEQAKKRLSNKDAVLNLKKAINK